jgi:predicted nucleic acid-binding protein
VILLDTNVVSQSMKPDGDRHVRDWLDSRDMTDFFICAPVLAELRFGALALPNGKKRDFLITCCERIENETFVGRVLPFDNRAAHCFAELRALKRSRGQAIPIMDAMIAAIALAHAMTLATRNVRDFEGLGVPLVDPFSQ